MRRFRDAVRENDFVLTAQLPLSPGTNADDLHRMVDSLRPVVDAVQVGDNTSMQPHMSPLAAASLALQDGIDPVVQLSCRDRNRIALQSDLMGAAALGVTSLVLTRGEKLPAAHKQRIKGVFDIGAQRLRATAQAIAANERLVAAPGFFLGSIATVIDPPENWTPEGLGVKAEAGAKFVQTQPCLDLHVLRKYMGALVARKMLERVSIIVQVPLLESPEALQLLLDARRPLLISEAQRARLETAGDFAAASAAVCAEALRDVRTIPGISGANILHHGDPAAVVRVVENAFRRQERT